MLRPVAGIALLVAVAFSHSGAAELTTLTGKKFTGELLAVTPAGVALRTATGDITVPPAEVAVVDFGHRPAAGLTGGRYAEVELTDGSTLWCGKFLIKGKKVELEPLPGPEGVPPPKYDLPLTAVFNALRRADDPKNRDEWKKVLAARGRRDLYVIRQADGLKFIRGTLLEGNAAGDTVTFEEETGAKSELLLSRASGGLVFNQTVPETWPPTLCKVHDVFGSVLRAKGVAVTGDGLTVTTLNGLEVVYPTRAAVVKLDYTQGNVVYLADLDAGLTTVPETPADDPFRGGLLARREDGLGDRALYLKDKLIGNEKTAPRLDGIEARRWVAVRAPTDSATTLTFAPNGDFRELLMSAGLPDAADRGNGSAKLTAEADGRVVYTGTFAVGDKPRAKEIALDVKGVKQVRLTVETAGPDQSATVLILAEARFQK